MKLDDVLSLRLSAYTAVLLVAVALLTGFLIVHGPVRAGQGAGPIGRVHTPLSAAVTNIVIMGIACYCLFELYQTLCRGGGILKTPRHARRLTLVPHQPVSLGSVTLSPREGLRVIVCILSGGCDGGCRIGIKLDASYLDGRRWGCSELLEMDGSAWRRRECLLCGEAHETIRGTLAVWLADATGPATLQVVWQRTFMLAPRADEAR